MNQEALELFQDTPSLITYHDDDGKCLGVIQPKNKKTKTVSINIRVTEDHGYWLTDTSHANKDCGISKVIRSLIQAEIDHEAQAANHTEEG